MASGLGADALSSISELTSKPDQLRRYSMGSIPTQTSSQVSLRRKNPWSKMPVDPTGKPDGTCTFSAPKSVSVVWTQAEQEERELIQRLHHQAIAETLQFAESTLAQSRTGHAGQGEGST